MRATVLLIFLPWLCSCVTTAQITQEVPDVHIACRATWTPIESEWANYGPWFHGITGVDQIITAVEAARIHYKNKFVFNLDCIVTPKEFEYLLLEIET